MARARWSAGTATDASRIRQYTHPRRFAERQSKSREPARRAFLHDRSAYPRVLDELMLEAGRVIPLPGRAPSKAALGARDRLVAKHLLIAPAILPGARCR